jgi:hypothetical protein
MQRPTTSEVMSAVRTFRAVVERGGDPNYTSLIASVIKLLEVAARMKGEQPGDENPGEPHRPVQRLARLEIVHAHFSELHSNHADDLDAEEWTTMPLDDLGDLYGDMSEVDDLFLGGREADARWEFRFGFESHWGEHALALIGYLLRSYRY